MDDVMPCVCFFFFFQAEDGIRDYKVTGVQTCALPIYSSDHSIVFPPNLVRGRMLVGRIPLGKDESLHPHSIHALYQEGQALLGGIARHRTQMGVLVPDPHVPAQSRGATELPGPSRDRQGAACAKTLQKGTPV